MSEAEAYVNPLRVVRPLNHRERDRLEMLVKRQVYLRTRIGSARPEDSAHKVNLWVREESALDWVVTGLQGSSPVEREMTAAMGAVADLLAETLALDGKYSPELDAARQKARDLLREWSARR